MHSIIIGKRGALSNFLRQFSTLIDPEKKTYKLEEGLFGIFKWGQFKLLPKIDYVLIFRSHFAKCEACIFEKEEDNPNAYFQVSLVYKNNRRIIVHETKNKTDAHEIANKLSEKLKTPLRDATSKT